MTEKGFCENEKCDNPNEERTGGSFMIHWATWEEPAEYAFYCDNCLAKAEALEREYAEQENDLDMTAELGRSEV